MEYNKKEPTKNRAKTLKKGKPMTRKQRLDYMAVVPCLYFAGFFLYFFLGYGMFAFTVQADLPVGSVIPQVSGLAFMAGYFLFSLISGMWIFVRLISKAPLGVKIAAALLFPLTISVAIYGGIFAAVPYPYGDGYGYDGQYQHGQSGYGAAPYHGGSQPWQGAG